MLPYTVEEYMEVFPVDSGSGRKGGLEKTRCAVPGLSTTTFVS